jgi:hypothetical protein
MAIRIGPEQVEHGDQRLNAVVSIWSGQPKLPEMTLGSQMLNDIAESRLGLFRYDNIDQNCLDRLDRSAPIWRRLRTLGVQVGRTLDVRCATVTSLSGIGCLESDA